MRPKPCPNQCLGQEALLTTPGSKTGWLFGSMFIQKAWSENAQLQAARQPGLGRAGLQVFLLALSVHEQ